ncbi:MAG: hypothetical protein ACM3S1_10260, partial [Hyphomicrobiales bacterium]
MGVRGTRDLLRLAGVLGVLAAAMSIWVAVESAPLPGDLWLTRHIQDWGRLDDNQALINGAHPWRWAFLGLATVLVLARWRLGGGTGPSGQARDFALLAYGAAVLLSFADTILKWTVSSPRPLAELGVRVEELRDSYGFPSGHVYGDVLVYGTLAATAPAWVHPRLVLPVRALCVAIIALAGP